MLIDACVTDDLDIVDGSRFALVHTHLEVDGVVLHVHLDGLYVEEEVTAVGIEFADGVIIGLQTFVEGLEIIDITGFDTQGSVQILIGIDGVTDPFDGADVVLVSFADGHIDIHAVGVLGVWNSAVRNDIGVTITVFVVFLDNRLFVFLVLGGNEFLGAEEVDDIVIVRFLHRLVDLTVGQRMVAGDIDLTDFRFGFLVHGDKDAHVARMVGVGFLDDVYLGVVESFVGKVFLDHRLGMILYVRGHLTALTDTGFDFYILPFTLFESFITHLADTGTLCQLDDEPDLIALDLLGFDLDIGEQTLFPETFDGFGDLCAGHLYLISHSETGEADEHKVFVTIRALYFDSRYLVSFAGESVLYLLRMSREGTHEQGA